MTSKPEEAQATFQQGFNCCQAVLSTYAEQLGLDRQTALKIGTAMGGGMGFTGQTCGAVSGAMLLIGLANGRTRVEDDAAKKEAYRLAREFAARFKAKYGSINCNELVGADIGTPDGLADAQKRGVFTTLCPKLVHDAAAIVEELLPQLKGKP